MSLSRRLKGRMMFGSLGKTWPIVKKEFRQIVRDPKSLWILLILPALILILYGYGLSLDIKHLPLWVFDTSRSSRSREYVAQFSHHEEFDFKGYIGEEREIRRFLDTRRAGVVLVVPHDFAERIGRGEVATVQAILDGSNATVASRAFASIEGINQAYSATIQTEELRRLGIDPLHSIEMEPRVWYNPELKSTEYLLPGLMGYILAIVCVVSTALSVVRERERGTMEQLAVSPLSPEELILGKVIPYILIAFITATLILVTGVVFFGLTIRGSLTLLFVLFSLYTTCNLGFGLLISSIADSQQAAFQGALLTSVLPSMILSGFIFPIQSMPTILQGVTYLVPARYFLVALRGIVLRGAGIGAFWEQLVILAGLSLLTLGISVYRIRKRLFGL
ncbi:MAG: ABC transporter permease [Candidatus Latescibacteria bacterium]|nr:ABC transporter permease [Candidatus Latescibacterota bacterium]